MHAQRRSPLGARAPSISPLARAYCFLYNEYDKKNSLKIIAFAQG